MSVKASVSVSEQQDAFMRSLVREGRFASASAVMQRGLELLRAEQEREAAELAALRQFFETRRGGDFETDGDSRAETRDMIARKRAASGL